MPQPIVFRAKYGPLDNLLVSLVLNKITHKQDMEREELRIKAKQAEKKEERTYQEGQTISKENRKDVRDARGKGWKLPEEINDPVRRLTGSTKKIGGKLMFYPDTPNETETHYPVWKNDHWEMTKKSNVKAYVNPKNPNEVFYRRAEEMPPKGTVPYSSPLVTINNKPSIGEKSQQETEAYLKTPKFRSDIINDVKRIRGRMWDIMEPQEQQSLAKSEADIRVKNTYPNARYGKDDATGEIGWFVKEGNKHRLVVPWSQ